MSVLEANSLRIHDSISFTMMGRPDDKGLLTSLLSLHNSVHSMPLLSLKPFPSLSFLSSLLLVE